MPSATYYTPDQRETRQASDQEFRERRDHHALTRRYYYGDHRKHLRVEGGADDNVTLNLCRQVIDRTVAFLVPNFPSIELDAQPAESESESWLRRAWEVNQGAVALGTMALNGTLDGHVFVRLMPEDPYPRVIPMNGANIITFWDSDDFTQVLWYEIRWNMERKSYRQDIVEDGGRWLIRDFVLQGSRWELQDEVIWTHPLSPIVDWQHLKDPIQFYGRDELPHAVLNDQINKVASDVARILRFHAYPRTIGTGFEATNVQSSGIDDFWVIPDKEARVFNLEMQSDLSASLRFLQLLTDAFLAESRVTMLNGDPDHFKGVTNLGVRVAYLDQIAKTEQLQRQYGYALREISRRLLMLGELPYEEAQIQVRWGEPLPTDPREEVQLLAQEIDLGLLDVETAKGRLNS